MMKEKKYFGNNARLIEMFLVAKRLPNTFKVLMVAALLGEWFMKSR